MAIIKQITLIVTFMKECRICMKTNITINPPASIIQQTLEPQQAFPPLVRDTVGPTYTMSKVGYTSPAPALASSNFGVAVRRGSLSKIIRRSSHKEEKHTMAPTPRNSKHASQGNSLALPCEKAIQPNVFLAYQCEAIFSHISC